MSHNGSICNLAPRAILVFVDESICFMFCLSDTLELLRILVRRLKTQLKAIREPRLPADIPPILQHHGRRASMGVLAELNPGG